MEKQDIIKLLNAKNDALIQWLEMHGDKYWEYGPAGKWTTGQHIIHLVQGYQPLNKALNVPKLVLKMKFGKSNRNCRTYDKIKERYLQKLDENKNIISPFSQNMPDSFLSEKDNWIKRFSGENDKMINIVIKKWNEKDLDNYVLPHPLMGKMPVRELLMWMAYHTEHHLDLIKVRAENSQLL